MNLTFFPKSESDCLQTIAKTIKIAKGGTIKTDLKDLVQNGLLNLPSSIKYRRQVMLKEIKK